MAEQAYGSVAHPYPETPFEKFIEVHWKTGGIVKVEAPNQGPGVFVIPLSEITPIEGEGNASFRQYAASALIPDDDLVERTFLFPVSLTPRVRWPSLPLSLRNTNAFFIGQFVAAPIIRKPHTFPDLVTPSMIVPPFAPGVLTPWSDFGFSGSANFFEGVPGFDLPDMRDKIIAGTETRFSGTVHAIYGAGSPNTVGPPSNFLVLWVVVDSSGTRFDYGDGSGVLGGGAGSGVGSLEVFSGQLREFFPIDKGPQLLNMKKGGYKVTKFKIVQPPVFPAGPFGIGNFLPDVGAFPPIKVQAYSGGKWRVAPDYSDVTNEGGTLKWETEVPLMPYAPIEQELLRFDFKGVLPPET